MKTVSEFFLSIFALGCGWLGGEFHSRFGISVFEGILLGFCLFSAIASIVTAILYLADKKEKEKEKEEEKKD